MGYCSCNIWNGLELKLAWSRINSSYFENNVSIFLWSGNSNTSVFKVYDGSHRVHFLVIKNFSNIFCSTIFWFGQVMFDYNLCPIFYNSWHSKIKRSSKWTRQVLEISIISFTLFSRHFTHPFFFEGIAVEMLPHCSFMLSLSILRFR